MVREFWQDHTANSEKHDSTQQYMHYLHQPKPKTMLEIAIQNFQNPCLKKVESENLLDDWQKILQEYDINPYTAPKPGHVTTKTLAHARESKCLPTPQYVELPTVINYKQ